jgi:hypothetical protein
MGASGWNYVTEYEGDVRASLKALQARVFQEEYGDDEDYASLEDLYADEYMAEEGTHTVLDITRVVATDASPEQYVPADHRTLRPLARDRVVYHFGTDRPTVEQYQELVTAAYGARTHEELERTLFAECRVRWTGYYVVLYSEDRATHLAVFGFSGD